MGAGAGESVGPRTDVGRAELRAQFRGCGGTTRLMKAGAEPGSNMNESNAPRQTLALKVGKRLRKPFNRWISKSSLVPNTPYLDPALFPWAEPLTRGWRAAQQELDQLLVERDHLPEFAKISPDHRRIAGDGKWKSFFFKAYGYRAEQNAARCPHTAALIESVPGVVVAFFSIMDAGIHVPRHKGV